MEVQSKLHLQVEVKFSSFNIKMELIMNPDRLHEDPTLLMNTGWVLKHNLNGERHISF